MRNNWTQQEVQLASSRALEMTFHNNIRWGNK